MSRFIEFANQYEWWIYSGLGLAACLSLWLFWSAYQRMEVTPFGLEKSNARRWQFLALTILVFLLGVLAATFAVNRYFPDDFNPAASALTPNLRVTATPTPTLVLSANVEVDSSGCPNVSEIINPTNGERLSGPYEIRGTANIPRLAFYKVEISGLTTNGAWVTLSVGREAKVDGSLGAFNTNNYPAGEYAFRLVVTDNEGHSLPPCVIAVTLAQTGLNVPTATSVP